MEWPARQSKAGFLPATEAPAKGDIADQRLRARIRHGRGALIAGAAFLLLFYLIMILADLLAPYDYSSLSRLEPNAPPTSIRFRDAQGRWSARPFIYARRLVDPLQQRYEEITDRAYPLELFTRGYSYKLIWTTNLHLFGARDAGDGAAPRLCLLGTDDLGRDRFSRLLIASRFSLLVGPIGTLLACALGVLIGVIAGYSRKWADAALMRAADVMMALPTLALILAARAAFPPELPYFRAGTLLVIVFIFLGWAEMARLARGLTQELRQREYVVAAESLGCSPARIIFRHILPNAARPLVTQTLLTLPAFMLAETALSFLGVGLQEPDASWGNLLSAVTENRLFMRGHAFAALSPAFAITLFVLGARLLGDGLEKRWRE